MLSRNNRTIVLGIGSEVLRDDGIGPKLVKDLSNSIEEDIFDYVTSCVGGMETIEIMKDYKEAIIIDGIFTEDGVPGTVYFMTYPFNKNSLHISNAHDVSFDLAVKLAAKLNIQMPQKIRIVAVEVIEVCEFGEELTNPLQKRYDEIFSCIVDMIRQDYVNKMPVC